MILKVFLYPINFKLIQSQDFNSLTKHFSMRAIYWRRTYQFHTLRQFFNHECLDFILPQNRQLEMNTTQHDKIMRPGEPGVAFDLLWCWKTASSVSPEFQPVLLSVYC